MNHLSFAFTNPLKERLGEEFFKTLPTEAGVYFFLDEDQQPLYIGKADCLKKRLASYKNAKPGQAPEHILEMLEHAREIVWEKHKDGAAALRREAELIRTLKPPFNIAGTDSIPYLYLGIKPGREQRPGMVGIEFRLSHNSMPEGFETFGCFMHRGKTKTGYSALLRLLFVIGCERERFHLPAKLCRTSPAYIHKGLVPDDLMKSLVRFLRGESPKLLNELTARLLEKENLPPYLYAPLQRDLMMAREFYQVGPQSTARMLKATGANRRRFLTQSQMNSAAIRVHLAAIRGLKREATQNR